jgi:primase-polymerase (primpol)-like protein
MGAALTNGEATASARSRILGDGAERPPRFDVRAENIPEELKTLDRWLVWKWHWKPNANGGLGKWDKPPINARTGGGGSSTDPTTWSSFDTALAAFRAGRGDGIGIALGKLHDGRNLTGVDVDDCRDPNTEINSEEALSVVELIGSYTDVSPSGTGLKLLCYGTLPAEGRSRAGYECYESGRYFTVTGHLLSEGPQKLRAATPELTDFHNLYIAPPQNWTPHSDREVAIEALWALSPSRADDYRSWILVGMALFATDPTLFDEWDRWSQQSSKYAVGACAAK